MCARAAPRAGYFARVPVVEKMMNVAFAALLLVGYQQVAAPTCRGQPHSLPPDSSLLASYPCQGTTAQRLLYLLRNTHLVLWDFFRLGVQERYLAFSAIGVLVRLLSSLFLPPVIYCEVIGPLTVYYMRSAVVLHYLTMGPGQVPSPLALSKIFETLMVFDVGGVVSLLFVWRVRPALELAHCAFMAVGLLVLCHWHGHRVPGGGVNIAWQMATRLAVPCITLYLGGALERPRRQGGRVKMPGSSGGGGGGGCSTSEMGIWVNGKTSDLLAEAEERGRLPEGSFKATATGAPTVHAAAAAAASAAAIAEECAGKAATHAHYVAAACEGGVAVGRINDAAHNSCPARQLLPVGQLPGPAVGLPPYKSPIRRRTVRYKIPWAEPEQLTPGYEQRLGELVAGKGLQLTAVYVRRGCVELTLVLEEMRGTEEAANGGGPGDGATHAARSAGSGTLLLQQPGQQQPQPPLDVDSLIRALGLSSLPEGEVLASEAPLGSAALLSGVSMRVLGATDGSPNAWGSDGGGGGDGDGPRVLSAWPRVLLLRQSVGGAKGSGGGPAGAAGAAGGSHGPAAEEVRVVVAWGAAGDDAGPTHGSAVAAEATVAPATAAKGAVRVEVRDGSGALLPARAVERGVTPADGTGAASCKYDIQLLQLPARPGNIVVELWIDGLNDGGSSSDGAAAAAARCGRLRSVVQPLLVVDDNGAAAELTAAAAGWLDGPAAASQLDDLLYDMGSWAAAVDEPVVHAAAAGGAAPCLGSLQCSLGPHLLQYARAAGWGATASWVASQIRRCDGAEAAAAAAAISTADGSVAGGGGDGAAVASGGDSACAAAAAAAVCGATASPAAKAAAAAAAPRGKAERAATAGSGAGGSAAAEAAADVSCSTGLSECAVDAVEGDGKGSDGDGGGSCGAAGGRVCRSLGLLGRRRSGGGCLRMMLRTALGLLVSEPSPSEAATLRAMADQWAAKLAETLQVIELLMLLALIVRSARAGRPLTCPENLMALTALGPGSVLTVAWLVLPYRTWIRLAVRARLPRYIGYMLSKALVGVGVSPPPVGVGRYISGPGVLLHEGLILPGANLLSPRTAMLVAVGMLVVNVGVIRACGVVSGVGAALLLAVRAEAAAVATTLACHAYLRLRLRSAGVARGRGDGAGGGLSPRASQAAGGEANAIGSCSGSDSGGRGGGGAAAFAAASADGSKGAYGVVLCGAKGQDED